MKKALTLILVLLSISILVACDQSPKNEYENGTHTAESEADEYGYKGVINITVEDSKITEVNYDEINDDGEKKSEDEEYGKTMEDSSGIDPKEAFEQLEEALVNTQDPERIDAVAGATASSEQFKKLAEEALKK